MAIFVNKRTIFLRFIVEIYRTRKMKTNELKLLTPNGGESEADFVKRFMGNDTMVSEYPDEKQRAAVAHSQYRKGEMSACNRLTLSSMENIKDAKTQEILVFPRGDYYIQKYDKTLKFDDTFFNQVALAFDAETLSKPFLDKDHDYGESHGNVMSYRIDEAGMHFTVELNEKGKEVIKDNRYKYISPAWGEVVDNKGTVYPNRLLTISLVNAPALQGSLPTLQAQITLSDVILNETLIVEKVKETKAMELKTLAVKLNLDSASELSTIELAIDNLKSELKAEKDKREGEEKKAIKLSTELTAIKRADVEKTAKSEIELAVKAGKVHPAVADIYIARFIEKPEDVKKELSLIPENFTKQLSGGGEGTNELSAEIVKKMELCGLNPKDKEDVDAFLSNPDNLPKEGK